MLNLAILTLPVLIILLDRTQLEAASVDCSGFSTNGCSIPGDLSFFYKELFTPACTRHDVCYHCGIHEAHRFTRKKCDNRFKRQMNKACKKQPWWSRYACYVAKNTYYRGVRLFGESYFNKNVTGLDQCEDRWVRKCMRK